MRAGFVLSGDRNGVLFGGSPRRSAALAATALVGLVALGAGPALAGVSETGTNNPAGAATGVNAIGVAAPGSLTIDAGSTFGMTGLNVGITNGFGTGTGSVLIDGSGSALTMTGSSGPVIGVGGTGTMTISNGGVLNNSAGTGNTVVGNFAGATGSLTVTGTGSTLSTSSTFNGPGLNVGTGLLTSTNGVSGGSTTGSVTASAGGTINSSGLAIGQYLFNSSLGSIAGSGQTAIGTVSVTGAGSTYNLNPVGSNSGTVVIGANNTNAPGSTGIGTLSISNGAVFNVNTSTITPATFQMGFVLGGNGTGANAGGSGTMAINGGTLNFNGVYSNSNTPFLVVGQNQGTGLLNVTNSGTINNLNALTVGRNGSTGTMTISGAGSTVNVIGEGGAPIVRVGQVQSSPSPPAGVTTATGTLNVQNGGALAINLNNFAGGSMQVGILGGSGTVNVSGTGSQIILSGNNNNDAVNTPGLQIGRSGSGALNVTNGGQVIVNDAPGYGYLLISGANGQVTSNEPAGTGNVLVSGTGSKIDIQSSHGSVTVGREGNGTLTIQNGGVVNAESTGVGRDAFNPAKPLVQPGAVGTLTVSGAGSQLNLSGNDGPNGTNVNSGARLAVGMAGTGTMNVSGGGAININPDNLSNAKGGGLFIGGSNTGLAGGTGTVNVTGGSSITIGGTATNSVVVVGGNGTGTLNVGGVGSSVSLPATGAMYVGAPGPGMTPTVPLSGSVTVSAGASLNAGSFLGIGSDGTNNNTGTGSFLLTGGATVSATNIVVGQHGLFGGNGTVNGAVTNNGGTIQVGASPDTLVINGAYVQNGGTINLEIFSDGQGGFLTDTLVFTGIAPVLTGVTFAFNFMNSNITPDQFFQGNNPLNSLSSFLEFTAPPPADFFASVIASSTAEVTTTPEPASLSLFAVGLGGLAWLRRRQGGVVRK